jgi:hypothetical protein
LMEISWHLLWVSFSLLISILLIWLLLNNKLLTISSILWNGMTQDLQLLIWLLMDH